MNWGPFVKRAGDEEEPSAAVACEIRRNLKEVLGQLNYITPELAQTKSGWVGIAIPKYQAILEDVVTVTSFNDALQAELEVLERAAHASHADGQRKTEVLAAVEYLKDFRRRLSALYTTVLRPVLANGLLNQAPTSEKAAKEMELFVTNARKSLELHIQHLSVIEIASRPNYFD
jgi:hypothetical protein